MMFRRRVSLTEAIHSISSYQKKVDFLFLFSFASTRHFFFFSSMSTNKSDTTTTEYTHKSTATTLLACSYYEQAGSRRIESTVLTISHCTTARRSALVLSLAKNKHNPTSVVTRKETQLLHLLATQSISSCSLTAT